MLIYELGKIMILTFLLTCGSIRLLYSMIDTVCWKLYTLSMICDEYAVTINLSNYSMNL